MGIHCTSSSNDRNYIVFQITNHIVVRVREYEKAESLANHCHGFDPRPNKADIKILITLLKCWECEINWNVGSEITNIQALYVK